MRILVVTCMPPAPALLTGGGQRSDLLLRALGESGDVDLFLVLPPRLCDERQLAQIREHHRLVGSVEWHAGRWAAPWRLGLWRLPGGFGAAARLLAEQAGRYRPEPRVAGLVRDRIADGYHLVVARYLEPALRAGLMTRSRSVPLAFDVDDVDSELLAAPHEDSRPPVRRSIEQRASARALRRALRHSDHVWFSSERDRAALAVGSSSVLPNTPWWPEGESGIERCSPAPGSRELLFVGTLGYEPNRLGVEHFVARIWPQIRAAVPDAQFRVVGSPTTEHPMSAIRETPGVTLTGFVGDLRAEYARAAFAIAPLYRGGGPKIKVVESLAYGRTCVVTPIAHAGYERVLRDRESLRLGANDVAIAEACIELLRDPAQRARLAETGCAKVAEYFGADAFRRSVRDGIEQAVAGRRGHSSPWRRNTSP